jgi:hypothetical protein
MNRPIVNGKKKYFHPGIFIHHNDHSAALFTELIECYVHFLSCFGLPAPAVWKPLSVFHELIPFLVRSMPKIRNRVGTTKHLLLWQLL